ncbi:hypothetical protein CLV91_0477 [Maribacter vaceletii]|uniref:Uncharacterized protein n=1 Tax=Maribacter vaceletii TaxID=1206816 RepID=A0A495EBZ9_9FLAO|nr:hypothetical protein CLV91_0477 [Maribacter vaceletii]
MVIIDQNQIHTNQTIVKKTKKTIDFISTSP